MTFSILARDPLTGAFGAAAATGSLCVGGWVLRGDVMSGLTASQGASPSVFWGEDALALMREGSTAEIAVKKATAGDSGREFRQLTAIDLAGGTGCFTGAKNDDVKGCIAFQDGVVAGNMLSNTAVLQQMIGGFEQASGSFSDRLISALVAAELAGGDYRGLLSAALLVLHPEHPPLTLRIDHHPTDPVQALAELHAKATGGDYARWAGQVPVATDRERILD